MGSVSKFAFSKVCHTSCCNISHPWSKSCIKGYWYMLTSSFAGTAKFFFIIYMVQYFTKNKSFSFDVIKETFVNYLRESCFGAFMSSGFVGSMCLCRYILQKYHYYTIALIPASIGGTAVFLIHPTRRGFSITTFQYLVLEILYKLLQESGIFKKTTYFETTFFMCCSSFLLYLLRIRGNSSTFMWFFSPSKVRQLNEKNDTRFCSHNGSCWRNIYNKETASYVIFGFLIQLARGILISLRSRGKVNILDLLLSVDTYLLGIFSGSYVITYKVITCFLCQYFKYDSAAFALPAGFVAGATYAIQPNLTIALIALTNLIKVSSDYIMEKGMLPKFPWQEISFIVSSGIIFHVRTMHPQICPKNARNLMSSMTNKRADEIYNAFKKCVDTTKKIS